MSLMHSVRIVLYDTTNSPDHSPKFVVLVEGDDPGNFKLPGGKFASEEETPYAAAARELMEELGVPADQVGLTPVGELPNDYDPFSTRFIFYGVIGAAALRPPAEIADIKYVTQDTVPKGNNLTHILAAVALCQTWEKNRTDNATGSYLD